MRETRESNVGKSSHGSEPRPGTTSSTTQEATPQYPAAKELQILRHESKKLNNRLPDPPSLDDLRRARQWLRKNNKKKGVAMIVHIISAIEEWQELDLSVDIAWPEVLLPDLLSKEVLLEEDGIAGFDNKARAAYLLEYHKLKREIEAHYALGLGMTPELQQKIRDRELIGKEIFANTTPWNSIRQSSSSRRREKQRRDHAMQRVLEEAQKKDPDVYSILKQSVDAFRRATRYDCFVKEGSAPWKRQYPSVYEAHTF